MERFHIHRFEFKYLLSEGEAGAVKEELLQYMVCDPYALKNVDRSYMVYSLYCDDDRYTSFWEKIDGISHRRKIRFRVYSLNKEDEPDIYLEIKRRKDKVILKDRAKLSYAFYHCLQENNYCPLVTPGEMPVDQQKVIDEALFNIIRYNMEPKLMIIYRREAFLGRYHTNLRVTFDRDIKGYKTSKLFAGYNILENVLGGDSVVMEVKFRGSLPWWFHDIIQRYGLWRTPYSKYCETLNALTDSWEMRSECVMSSF